MTGQSVVDVSTIKVVLITDSAGIEELATPTALEVGCSVHFVQIVLVDVRKTVEVVTPTDVSMLVVPAVVCVFVDVTGHVVTEVSMTTVVMTSLGRREVVDWATLAEELWTTALLDDAITTAEDEDPITMTEDDDPTTTADELDATPTALDVDCVLVWVSSVVAGTDVDVI